MKTEFEDRVRDSMTWFTNGVHVPAGLAARAQRHNIQRRRRRAGWLAAGMATAGATALIVAAAATGQVAPAHPNPGPAIKAKTTAQIVSQVSKALTGTLTAKPVEKIRMSLAPIGGAVLLAIPKNLGAESVTTWDTWSRGRVLEEAYIGSSGRVVARDHVVFGPRISVTFFSYKYRIWRHTMQYPPPIPPFRPYCDPDPLSSNRALTAAQWSSEIRKLLTCGTVTNAGYQRVDGVNAIKLIVHPVPVRACDDNQPLSRCKHVVVLPGLGDTLWVSRATFLPVRMTTFEVRLDFRWLPPNPANLALLRQQIPPGFRFVPGTFGFGF